VSAETLFVAANATALIGWVLLAFAPLRRAALVLGARIVAVGMAVLYAGLLIGAVTGGGAMEVDFTTLSGLTAGFARPEAVLVGWVHYLAFDLWVGAWAVEDAGRRRVPHWAMLPALFLTLMAGPIGLLVYLAVRAALGRSEPGQKAASGSA